MTNNLHDFVPPFTLHLNTENAPNPARKHFEKTDIINHGILWYCTIELVPSDPASTTAGGLGSLQGDLQGCVS